MDRITSDTPRRRHHRVQLPFNHECWNGADNTAIGWGALQNNTASDNTAVGSGACPITSASGGQHRHFSALTRSVELLPNAIIKPATTSATRCRPLGRPPIISVGGSENISAPAPELTFDRILKHSVGYQALYHYHNYRRLHGAVGTGARSIKLRRLCFNTKTRRPGLKRIFSNITGGDNTADRPPRFFLIPRRRQHSRGLSVPF